MKKFILGVLVIIFIFFLAFFCFSTKNKPLITNKGTANNNQPVDLSIFAKILQRKKIVAEPPTTTLIAAGDVMLGRSINYRSVKLNNFTWPFEKTANVLKNADIAFVNLESPFVENCPSTNVGMTFCEDARHIEGFIYAGIDIVNLANNHIGNFGQEGIKQTIRLLESNEILPIGTTNGAVFKTVNSIRFTFLGYNDFASPAGIAQVKKEKIVADIANAKTKSDVIVVSFHWGNEYTDKPTKRQQELAYLAIDNGADLIIGHHPHWIQPAEQYKDKLIIYSLGNFIFDQGWSQKTKEGIVGKFEFSKTKLTDYELLPILIDNFGQPSFILDKEKRESKAN